MFFLPGEFPPEATGWLKAIPAAKVAVVSVTEDGDVAGDAAVFIAVHFGRGLKDKVIKRTETRRTTISAKKIDQGDGTGGWAVTSCTTDRLSFI